MIMLRCLIVSVLLLVFYVHAPKAQQPAVPKCNADTKLCIGVRSNARPFSYKAELQREMSSDATVGPLRSAHYTGYMVHICDAVLVEMMLPSRSGGPLLPPGGIGIYDLDQPSGRQKDEKATTPDRFGDLGVKYDILCDPATITNDRRNEFIVSPPLFLTGISYITIRGVDAPPEVCDRMDMPLIGLVGNTTANKEGLWALYRAGELPRQRAALLAYLKGDSSKPAMARSPCKGDTVGRIIEFATHKEAAMAFCDGEFFHYVGDLEIITENVKLRPDCGYDNGTRTFTNDRYAIFGKPRSMRIPQASRERQLLVAHFFQILTQKTVFNPSLLDRAYRDTFQDAAPSRKLQAFLWSIRGGKLNVQ